ncbi:MAG: hypothetical protein Q8R98_24485 [Rubrivivax sp.]|nr:hypothetical protein [Rubrivivax sp.]MDZ4053446.1 hypothetical protein [Phenylobacterium sp.]
MTELVIENGEAYYLSSDELEAFLEDRAAGGNAGVEQFGCGLGLVHADFTNLTKHEAIAQLVKLQAERRERQAA